MLIIFFTFNFVVFQSRKNNRGKDNRLIINYSFVTIFTDIKESVVTPSCLPLFELLEWFLKKVKIYLGTIGYNKGPLNK